MGNVDFGFLQSLEVKFAGTAFTAVLGPQRHQFCLLISQTSLFFYGFLLLGDETASKASSKARKALVLSSVTEPKRWRLALRLGI